MKIPGFAAAIVCLVCFAELGVPLSAAPDAKTAAAGANGSVQQEIDLALSRGARFLMQQQSSSGAWSNPKQPALSALPLIALAQLPGNPGREVGQSLEAGLNFLRTNVKPDGGIYAEALSNYNTAVCTLALLKLDRPSDGLCIENARRFLVGQQASGMVRAELDGGIGYGPNGVSPKRQHPDLDNTLVSLEALRACAQKERSRDKLDTAKTPQLNWEAAIGFISRCQNRGAGDDAGGFVYYPGFSNAGETKHADGTVGLRSYGSMSYAGFLSLLYAEVTPSDPRVVAAMDWIGRHFTLEENPGMGEQGLFYYYHLMAKALSVGAPAQFQTASGVPRDWARELGLKLLQLQLGDGSWSNRNGRWMESDSVLVTAYSMMALELVRERL